MVLPKESNSACSEDLYYLLLSGRAYDSRPLSRYNNRCSLFLKNPPVTVGCHNGAFLYHLFSKLFPQIQYPQGMSALLCFQRWRLDILGNGRKEKGN